MNEAIPSEMGKLVSLEYLDLSKISCDVRIVQKSGTTAHLTRKDLFSPHLFRKDNNMLTGLLPSEIGNMDSLEVIDLGKNFQ